MPFAFGEELKIFKQQDADECCPNLNLYRVIACANKRFYFQVLLECLEEQLNLPAVFVNQPYRSRAEFQMVHQQHNLAIVFIIPYHHASKHVRTNAACLIAGKTISSSASTLLVCGN
jgi:hypothetical protein